MTPSEPDAAQLQREEEAATWLVEREEGFSPDRATAFAQWLARDPRHASAFASVEKSLALLEEMPTVRSALEKRVGPISTVPDRSVNLWPWAAGLAAALVMAVSWWTYSSKETAPALQVYEVVDEQPRRISLPDGSIVDLNARSRFEYVFTAQARSVILTGGEAHFQVAHDSARPFTVRAAGVAIRAVGTAFNVRIDGPQVDVLVAEGKVQVAREVEKGKSVKMAPSLIPLLVAGERVRVTSSDGALSPVAGVSPSEIDSMLSWQNAMTSFVDVPLGEMIARINRCSKVQLALSDPEMGRRRVGGVINLQQAEAFVNLLEQDGGMVADRSIPGKIVLRPAR